MNKKEIEKRLNDIESLITESKYTVQSYKQEKKQLKKQLEEIPILEVGKWYKLTSDYCMLKKGMVFIVVKNQGGKNSDCPFWIVNHNMFLGFNDGELNYIAPNQNQLIRATDKEVETALIAEAKKRGFKEGVTINGTSINKGWYKSNIVRTNEFCFLKIFNSLGLLIEDNCIFNNGKWAEIIQPKTVWLEGDYTLERLKQLIESKF